jgi:hypothetical protein
MDDLMLTLSLLENKLIKNWPEIIMGSYVLFPCVAISKKLQRRAL